MSSQKKYIRSGFTLTEMVIVLAIVTVLSALMFPLAGKIRENARRATCQSNLKQMGLAFHLYLQDSNGRFSHGSTWTIDSFNKATIDGYTWQDELKPYVKTSGIFVCPSSKREAMAIGNARGNEDYIYNFGKLVNISQFFPIPAAGRSESEIVKASNIWMVTDWDDFGGASNNDSSTYLVSSCGRAGNYNNQRHFGGANYLFVDGHVKWFAPETIAEMECLVE